MEIYKIDVFAALRQIYYCFENKYRYFGMIPINPNNLVEGFIFRFEDKSANLHHITIRPNECCDTTLDVLLESKEQYLALQK